MIAGFAVGCYLNDGHGEGSDEQHMNVTALMKGKL